MPARPHICFFPGQLQLGGIGRITLNLAEALLERGARVDVFLSRRAGVYVAQIPTGVNVFAADGSVKASVPGLVRYLRRERPHMLVAARPYINLTALAAARLARVDTQVVVTEHTNHATEKRVYTGIRKPLIRAACRFLYPRADHVVAISSAVADDMVENLGLSRDRVRIIHNAVVTRRILELGRQPAGHPWFDGPTPVILGVGRLTLQKNFHALVRAFARVRAQVPARLVILGEGEDRQSLERLAQELGVAADVDLFGFAENPFACMARAAVFALPSRWEGLPTVLIEALAMGTPVVATDCPGGSREILADGEFGHLVAVEDVDGLARAIRDALSNPAPAGKLRRRAMDFSADRATARYLELLEPGSGRVRGSAHLATSELA
jgi:glycosyltransferase involved in cell wall biosynthesis